MKVKYECANCSKLVDLEDLEIDEEMGIWMCPHCDEGDTFFILDMEGSE